MCHSNPERAPTTKLYLHTSCGCPLFTHCAFDTTKNKLNYYRGKDYMKSFCKDLRKHAREIVNFGKKKRIDTINSKEKDIISQSTKLPYM